MSSAAFILPGTRNRAHPGKSGSVLGSNRNGYKHGAFQTSPLEAPTPIITQPMCSDKAIAEGAGSIQSHQIWITPFTAEAQRTQRTNRSKILCVLCASGMKIKMEQPAGNPI